MTVVDRELITAARGVLPRAYAPYSSHPVGAAARVVDAHSVEHVVGVNMENVINRLSVCAEQSLVSSLVSTLESPVEVLEVVVVGPDGELLAPCGACRQLLVEHCAPWCVVNGSPASALLSGAPDIDLGSVIR